MKNVGASHQDHGAENRQRHPPIKATAALKSVMHPPIKATVLKIIGAILPLSPRQH